MTVIEGGGGGWVGMSWYRVYVRGYGMGSVCCTVYVCIVGVW